MSTRIKIVKRILGIIGFISFFAMLGKIGNIEQNVGNDNINFLFAFLFLALMVLCAWLNEKINEAFGYVDEERETENQRRQRILEQHKQAAEQQSQNRHYEGRIDNE